MSIDSLYYEMGVMAYNTHQTEELFTTLPNGYNGDYDYRMNYKHIIQAIKVFVPFDQEAFSIGFKSEHENYIANNGMFYDREESDRLDYAAVALVEKLIEGEGVIYDK